MKTETLRKLIERKTTVSHSGQKHIVTPRLVETIFGDGKRLIGLAPTMYRPHHFVVRIDSTWSLNNHAIDVPLLIDNLDEVYDAIEEEYIDWPWWKEYGLDRDADRDEDLCARVDWNDGSCWWEEDWPKKPRNKRKVMK